MKHKVRRLPLCSTPIRTLHHQFRVHLDHKDVILNEATLDVAVTAASIVIGRVKYSAAVDPNVECVGRAVTACI